MITGGPFSLMVDHTVRMIQRAMQNRWLALSLGAMSLCACTDPVMSPYSAVPQLTNAQYALQLRGDPLLATIADILGHPELAKQIDNAVLALAREGTGSEANSLLASVHLSLSSTANQDVETQVGESDVLAAVVAVTVDRLAQLADSAGFSSNSPLSP